MALEKILAEEKETPEPASDQEVKPEETKEDEEIKKKAEIKANLDKAIDEAKAELTRIRTEKKQTRPPEDELPKIDMDDPASKAWDKHITDKVIPVSQELEKEKEEIRSFAIQEFLADKPALASNPEKVKELVSTYERLRTATERTKEGVLLDLGKAYGAIYYEESLARARAEKAEQIRMDEEFSAPAVSRGATSYSDKSPRPAKLSDEDRKIVEKWDDSLARLGIKMDK